MTTGQLIYLGPPAPREGLKTNDLFRNGIPSRLQKLAQACPSIGELFVPITENAAVRRELAFHPLTRQPTGTDNKYVTFYRQAQKWLASQTKQPLEIQSHA